MKGTVLDPRAEELLVERALRPLDEREQWELQQLHALDDESFDQAAAAIVIATSAAESLPQHLADKILAGAPQPDFRRTLPGVVMAPGLTDTGPALPRDTMVGVEIATIAPELAEPAPQQVEIVVPTQTLPPGQTLPPNQLSPITTVPPSQPPGMQTLPPPGAMRRPGQPTPPAAQPIAPQPPFASQPQHPVQPFAAQPSQPPPPVQPSQPQPPVQPFQASQPLPLDTQPQPAAMRGIPLPQETLPPGEAPPIVAPIIDLSARRAQAAPEPARRASLAPWLAAALCLLVAGGAVVWALVRDTTPAKVAITPPSPAADRAALLASATDLAKITWTPTQDTAARGATGDVVWSPAQQKGFMRFVGLAQNDPKQFQYQLWIFDKTRDQAFPVDGGVFDVSSTGEVIVPISAKLHVNDATLFAVTVEKPGGVVVSKRERIVVTAQRG